MKTYLERKERKKHILISNLDQRFSTISLIGKSTIQYPETENTTMANDSMEINR
jgi:hypothetical protein